MRNSGFSRVSVNKFVTEVVICWEVLSAFYIGRPHIGNRAWRTTLSMSLACLLLFCLSRQQLLSYKLLQPQLSQLLPAPHCCTPAVLYNREQLGGLVSYLEQDVSEEPVDLAISR